MDQKTMIHLHNGILLSRKKEGAPTLCDSMDGTGEHYAKWNKSGNERQIPYDLTINRSLINKTSKQEKYNRLTVKLRFLKVKNSNILWKIIWTEPFQNGVRSTTPEELPWMSYSSKLWNDWTGKK